eukprot:gene5070-biopygen9168
MLASLSSIGADLATPAQPPSRVSDRPTEKMRAHSFDGNRRVECDVARGSVRGIAKRVHSRPNETGSRFTALTGAVGEHYRSRVASRTAGDVRRRSTGADPRTVRDRQKLPDQCAMARALRLRLHPDPPYVPRPAGTPPAVPLHRKQRTARAHRHIGHTLTRSRRLDSPLGAGPEDRVDRRLVGHRLEGALGVARLLVLGARGRRPPLARRARCEMEGLGHRVRRRPRRRVGHEGFLLAYLLRLRLALRHLLELHAPASSLGEMRIAIQRGGLNAEGGL